MPEYYGTITDGDIYFAKMFAHDDWKDASDADKTGALFEATQHIEVLNFIGSKTISTQDLQFPRGGDTVVPKAIEYATYEEAYEILTGRINEDELKDLQVTKYRFGNVHTEFNPKAPAPQNVTAGILSSKAWRFLYPYFRRADQIRLVRV